LPPASSRRTRSGFLGVPPQLGRPITDADAAPGAPPVFVMSQKMWIAQYSQDSRGRRPYVCDQRRATTCIGVMPPRFTKQAADLWKPLTLDRADPQQQRRYIVFQAKLKPGISFERATAEMDLVAGASRSSTLTTTRRSSPCMS
jgi:hypothetical protein